MDTNVKRYWSGLIDAVVLLLLFFYISDKLQWPLLFEKTTAAGGDMASHYPTAVYLKNVLLPEGRLIGWYPGNFCGFPLFQFYFPLPFLGIVCLSFFIPMEISFKLISVLGIYLLPACSYLSLRLARLKFPIPVLAAIFSLAFLFSEGNSMWGGNVLSNLAGEFGFQISFSLSILFLFSIYRNINTSRHVIANGLLLSVIGLCHGVGLIFAVLVPTFFLIHPVEGLWKRLLYLLRINGLALGFMDFWFFPFLAGADWSTTFNLLWHISGIREIFPEILWPFLAVAVTGSLGIFIFRIYRYKKTAEPVSETFVLLLYLWWAMGVAAILFETAYELNVVDIRFLPYAEYLPTLIAAILLGGGARFFRGSPVLLLILLLSTGAWINHRANSANAWSKWNYSGFEKKPAWQTFSAVNGFLKGDENDPRVVYEHSPLHNRFGTVRAFESLPHFSGRSTIEGLYMQSSITAPFAFYLQSEISSPGSFPLPQYDYSSPNLDRALAHFKLFNIGRYIAISDPMKLLAKANNGLESVAEFDDVEIFNVTGETSGYVVPLLVKPVKKDRPDWRLNAYQWFRKYDGSIPFIVYPDKRQKGIAGIADLAEFSSFESLRDDKFTGDIPHVSSRLSGGNVNIRTSETGRPLLVKISYHPNWHCEGALGPFLVSPSFMMIIPTDTDIKMVFKRGAADYAGAVITLFTILFCGFYKTRRVDFLLHDDWIIRPLEISRRRRKMMLFVSWTVAVGMVFTYTIHKRLNSPVRLRQSAMQYYSSGDLDGAVRVFKKMLSLSENGGYGDDAAYFLGLSYWRKKDYGNALSTLTELTRTYPESRFVPESLYHIVMCQTLLGHPDKAEKTFKRLLEQFPQNPWTGHADQYFRANDRVK
jgi:hypothetical protein